MTQIVYTKQLHYIYHVKIKSFSMAKVNVRVAEGWCGMGCSLFN